ncbi:MAG: hypothetical protein QF794_10700 [Candidatus Marinimicrobia bacterium]|nr:hypothetical protein [Candidatus Neomarinimicrobiota bacterium]
MMKRFHIFIILAATVCIVSCYTECGNAKCPPSWEDGFPKQAIVFGIKVIATENTSDEKVLHAAKIMAQYLDNDEDGEVDNQLVADKLISVDATLVMFKDENELDNFDSDEPDHDHYQLLFDEETIPSFIKNSSNVRFDASIEEVLHLITHEGYSKVYTSVLGELKGSAIANAMDKARGGYFESPPSTYPAGAWYSYDDETCEYDCMVTEYFYWALTSIMGAQGYPDRLDEIGHEWKLNTSEKVKTGDPDVYNILTDPQYNLPTVLPNDEYKGFTISLEK